MNDQKASTYKVLITYKAFFKKSWENKTLFFTKSFCIIYPSVPQTSAVAEKVVLNSATSSGRRKFLMNIQVEMEVPPLLSLLHKSHLIPKGLLMRPPMKCQ